MAQALLEVINATKIYGGGFLQGGRKVVALQNLNLTISDKPAMIVTIAGESGSGAGGRPAVTVIAPDGDLQINDDVAGRGPGGRVVRYVAQATGFRGIHHGERGRDRAGGGDRDQGHY